MDRLTPILAGRLDLIQEELLLDRRVEMHLATLRTKIPWEGLHLDQILERLVSLIMRLDRQELEGEEHLVHQQAILEVQRLADLARINLHLARQPLQILPLGLEDLEDLAKPIPLIINHRQEDFLVKAATLINHQEGGFLAVSQQVEHLGLQPELVCLGKLNSQMLLLVADQWHLVVVLSLLDLVRTRLRTSLHLGPLDQGYLAEDRLKLTRVVVYLVVSRACRIRVREAIYSAASRILILDPQEDSLDNRINLQCRLAKQPPNPRQEPQVVACLGLKVTRQINLYLDKLQPNLNRAPDLRCLDSKPELKLSLHKLNRERDCLDKQQTRPQQDKELLLVDLGLESRLLDLVPLHQLLEGGFLDSSSSSSKVRLSSRAFLQWAVDYLVVLVRLAILV